MAKKPTKSGGDTERVWTAKELTDRGFARKKNGAWAKKDVIDEITADKEKARKSGDIKRVKDLESQGFKKGGKVAPKKTAKKTAPKGKKK